MVVRVVDPVLLLVRLLFDGVNERTRASTGACVKI